MNKELKPILAGVLMIAMALVGVALSVTEFLAEPTLVNYLSLLALCVSGVLWFGGGLFFLFTGLQQYGLRKRPSNA